jgi:hypothetical protein
MTAKTSLLATVAALSGVAAVVACVLLLREQPPAPVRSTAAAEEPPAEAPAEPMTAEFEAPWTLHAAQTELTNKPSPKPLHRTSRYPPYTMIPITWVPEVEHGIRLPDGRKIPFLNGITAAPDLQRDPHYGPVPKIVALMVDGEGFEWWLHADNSATTTRYKQVTLHGTTTYWDVATEHMNPVETERIRTAEMTPPGSKGQ